MEPPPPFFAAILDPARHQACTKFIGHLTGRARAAAAQVEALLPQLKTGFSLLADFSQVEAMDMDTVPHLTRIRDRCREQGVGLIVRLLPAPERDIGIELLG